MDTRMARNGATIGQITTDVKDLNRLGKDLDQKLIKDGAIHIEMPGKKMPGKKTPGKQTTWQVIGTLTQAPLDQDGMQEKVGIATMPHATRQLKEITQQRVLHIKMSTCMMHLVGFRPLHMTIVLQIGQTPMTSDEEGHSKKSYKKLINFSCTQNTPCEVYGHRRRILPRKEYETKSHMTSRSGFLPTGRFSLDNTGVKLNAGVTGVN